MTKPKLTKRSKRLLEAMSTAAISLLEEGNVAAASRLHNVSCTLKADPDSLNRLSSLLKTEGRWV